jgi:hypothetical protein
MITYSNPYVLGNTGVPPDTLGHNATWPEGLARDNSDYVYEVRGWDEAHYDINKRDPGNGNIVWTSLQVVSGSDMHAIAVDPDGSFAYVTNAGGNRTNSEAYAWIYRINLAQGLNHDQRRTDFTSAGNHIAVYNSGQIPSTDPDFEPLHSIAVSGGSFWVSDAKGGRLIKYDKVSGVQQQIITGVPNARGLTIDQSGNLWVGCNGNVVRCYSSAGTLIDSTAASATESITALSIIGNVMAVALRTGGVRTYTVSGGKLTTLLSSYGQPWRPGDGAPDRVKDVQGMVQLSDGSIIFADRMGFTGRVQKAGGWIHLGLEFTAGATFHPSQPDRVFTSSRNVYSVATNGTWSLLGNALTEDYYHPSFFGWWQSSHGGPPKLLKHGGNFFLYYATGASLAIYRVIENAGRGPSLQICGCLCGSGQPGLDGSTTEEPWLDQNRVTWQWTDPVGDGVIRPANQEVISAQDPSSYLYINTCSVDDLGNLWIRELDADRLIKIPLNSLNLIGNPVYKFQDRAVVFTRPQIQAALGVTDEVEFQLAGRADGDVYFGAKVKNNPSWPIDGGQWMGYNAILCITETGTLRWAKQTPFWTIGIQAIDHNGGYVCGSNNTLGPGTIYHFDSNGNQLKELRPDTRFGDNAAGPRYPSGGLDSFQSINVARDPRDGEVKVFAADNLNQRIIVYSIADGLVPPITPPPIEPPPITPPPITPPPVVLPPGPPDQEIFAHVRIWTVPHRLSRGTSSTPKSQNWE